MKRIAFAVLLAFAALSATTAVWADSQTGTDSVPIQSP